MKIKKDDSIVAMMQRCRNNLSCCELNDYLDGYIDRKNEKAAKKQLFEAGQQEFEGNSEISLFISAKEWKNSPYHKNVHLENVLSDHFSYENVTVEGGCLFNSDAIQPDKDKELKDWMKLRALDEDVESIFLFQDDKEWMMDVPSEAITNDPHARKAHGKVITFGLGIGYFIYMAMLNPEVKSVTVVERSGSLIEMFKEKLLPQFPNNIPVEFICGDAFDYFNEEHLKKYDYVYVDIYQSGNDGLDAMEKMCESYCPPVDKVDFWIEDSCIQTIRTLIFLHFEELISGKTAAVSEEYKGRMNKVRHYFASIDETVSSPERLKYYMYDRKTIREILHDCGKKIREKHGRKRN